MKQIPMLDLKLEYEYMYMKEDIDAAIKKCLDHQKGILGPEVEEIENKIAGYLDVKHCIGASSGTEALVLSLRALAIKLKGQEYFDETDEIITPPLPLLQPVMPYYVQAQPQSLSTSTPLPITSIRKRLKIILNPKSKIQN